MVELPSILIVDDSGSNRIRFSITLKNYYSVETADSSDAAIQLFRRRQLAGQPFQAILVDYLMPQKDGLGFLAELREIDTEVSVVMISAHPSISSASQAMRLEAFDYLEKMCSRDQLLATMAEAVRKTVARGEAERQRGRGQAAEELVHDLSSPVSAISVVTSLLPAGNEHVKIVRSGAQRCHDLMQAWHAQIRSVPYLLKWSTPRTILQGVESRLTAELRGVRLKMGEPSELCEINVDETQFLRVVENLVRNAAYAVIHSEGGLAGGIRVSDQMVDGVYRFIVQDTGMGIPADALEKVFERGFSTKGAEGSGLGLCICHKIVRDFGGDLQIDSRPGLGTSVAVHLPCRPHRVIVPFASVA